MNGKLLCNTDILTTGGAVHELVEIHHEYGIQTVQRLGLKSALGEGLCLVVAFHSDTVDAKK